MLFAFARNNLPVKFSLTFPTFPTPDFSTCEKFGTLPLNADSVIFSFPLARLRQSATPDRVPVRIHWRDR